MCEQPSPVIHKFRGVFSINNLDFSEVNERNFAMRGSVLRNTGFMIGIVVYVGTDTKAHQNAKTQKRKTSWLINRMHAHFINMFIAMALTVFLLSAGGLAIDLLYDFPYLYINAAKMEEQNSTGS
eukprot:CAMPEP_0170474898 /NCGR_PEP_ID=MMETSP0123-20130129/16639_1 /TAXON_ID=182087 /ORGANISM="Favella ehrenbergii, Strain Fehren 1" /LENGTH=124 /DNA_ID=CAMNT_0010745049 /DNA_START=42 /DNA_END=413 /DNA_ORIENTATION=-